MLAAVSLVLLAAIPAGAMTITFIRHAESQGNASGYIDTQVPGPGLTEKGWVQAKALPDKLADQGIDYEDFDAVYASTMIRTQLTALPLLNGDKPKDEWTIRPTVIGTFDSELGAEHKPQSPAGIQEISAGIFEGTSQEGGIGRIAYALAPMAWVFGLRFVRIPGSEDGNEFAARMEAAIAQMETGENGETHENVAAFSHGATIMFWTMMSVDNPDLLLMLEHQLDNTDIVVVDKNDDGSYTLKSWAGQEVGEANYPTKMLVNVRDLIVAPQTAVYNVQAPLFNLDAEGVANSVGTGVRDVGEAAVKFVRDSVTDTVEAIGGLGDVVSNRAALTEDAEDPASTTVTSLSAKRSELVRELRTSVTDIETRSESVRTLARDAAAAPGKLVTETRQRVRATLDEARDTVRATVTEARDGVRAAVQDSRTAIRTVVDREAKVDRTAKDAA